MKVAILIVSYRSWSDVESCLDALARSTYGDFAVTIRENGGEAAWATMQACVPKALPQGQAVTLLPGHDNLGFAGGVNACLAQAAPADAYWILNPDTEPYPDALPAMVSRMERGDCGVVGHDLILPHGRLASRGGGHWRRLTALAVSLDHGKPREPCPAPETVQRAMNYVVGASMLVSAGFVDRVGLMREDYFLYCEEVEWCLRGLAAGEQLGYAADALVVHRHGTSTGGGGPMAQRSKLSVYLQERNRLLLTRDVFGGWVIAATFGALFHLCLRYGKALAWRQLGYALSGWFAGVSNRRGAPAWLAASPGPL